MTHLVTQGVETVKNELVLHYLQSQYMNLLSTTERGTLHFPMYSRTTKYEGGKFIQIATETNLQLLVSDHCRAGNICCAI